MTTLMATKQFRAGRALKDVLTQYGVSQNSLAIAMQISRSTVNQWVNLVSDPLADSVPAIAEGLMNISGKEIEGQAMSKSFSNKFLGREEIINVIN